MMHFIHAFEKWRTQVEVTHIEHYLHLWIKYHGICKILHYVRIAVRVLAPLEIPGMYVPEYLVILISPKF